MFHQCFERYIRVSHISLTDDLVDIDDHQRRVVCKKVAQAATVNWYNCFVPVSEVPKPSRVASYDHISLRHNPLALLRFPVVDRDTEGNYVVT